MTVDTTGIEQLIREISFLEASGQADPNAPAESLCDLFARTNPDLLDSLLEVMNSGCCHQHPADIDDNASTGAPSTTAGGSTAGLLSSDDLASSHSSYEYSTHHLGRSSPTPSLASDSDLLRRQSAGYQQQSAAMGLNNNGSNGSPGPMVPVNVEELLRTGNDKRTTVMIKRIPRRYTVAMLRDEIDRRCPALRNGGYDLLYLPVDTAKVANRGYAFINFRSPKHVLVFASAFQNYEWPGQRAHGPHQPANGEVKECEIYFAHIQGREETIRSVDPTGNKNTTSPAYQSIGDDKCWVLGYNEPPGGFQHSRRGSNKSRNNNNLMSYTMRSATSGYPSSHRRSRNDQCIVCGGSVSAGTCICAYYRAASTNGLSSQQSVSGRLSPMVDAYQFSVNSPEFIPASASSSSDYRFY
ncbi:hypothetical protein FOZ61_008804 [Perkinsus olseni]|uniref:Mei2-like C-terminal RNA recognition motif domain-containing protein n=1 Tax=Perkinsus olseni TaxID=32597 RepID=A0A7J6MXI1_PEROL|nr:hypothetical protein FOZ61_008804 [Perkinsus olseni]KAF4676253.1 hypothetical protein FOL46_006262 [Perkinsus olseni]